jgi:hypothetical protein
MNIHAKKIVERGKEYVQIPAAEFARILEALEDASDLRAIGERKEEESFPAEFVQALLNASRTGDKVRLWREYRGLSKVELGRIVGTTGQNISMIESSRRQGNKLLHRIAKALDCDMDDLV